MSQQLLQGAWLNFFYLMVAQKCLVYQAVVPFQDAEEAKCYHHSKSSRLVLYKHLNHRCSKFGVHQIIPALIRISYDYLIFLQRSYTITSLMCTYVLNHIDARQRFIIVELFAGLIRYILKLYNCNFQIWYF